MLPPVSADDKSRTNMMPRVMFAKTRAPMLISVTDARTFLQNETRMRAGVRSLSSSGGSGNPRNRPIWRGASWEPGTWSRGGGPSRSGKKRFGWGSPERALEAVKRAVAEARSRAGNVVTREGTRDLINAGARWVDREVVTDSGIITSRKPADITAFANKLMEEIAEGVHAGRASVR